MKLLTEDCKVVDGRLLSETEAIFIDDVNNAGIPGLALYNHQKKEFIKFMLTKYDLRLKETKEEDPVENYTCVPDCFAIPPEN